MTPQELATFEGVAGDAGVVFFFTGEFTPSGIATLGETLRRRLGDLQFAGKPSRKLFSAFVEMAQNVLHYSASGGDSTASQRGSIVIGDGGDHHWIACSNLVQADHATRLRERLDAIERMTPEELREAYRRQLQDDGHEANDALSQGAGLGLLTIARAARGPLEHSFSTVPGTDGLTRFVLCARLDTTPSPQERR